MKVLDTLDPGYQESAFTDKPTWPQTPWKSTHLIHKWQGYGSANTSMSNDWNKPSVFVSSGDYAIEAGANYTAAEYTTADYEDWPDDGTHNQKVEACPHVGPWVPANNFNPPYDALVNIQDTADDVNPQISGVYAYYNWGPSQLILGEGNACYDPDLSAQQGWVNKSSYRNWNGYPAGSPSEQTDLLFRIQHIGEECFRYLPQQFRAFNTSFMYIDSDAAVALPIAEWRALARQVFHFHNALMLWYHRSTQSGGAYIIPWADAAVQANVDAIQEEYDKLWTNMIVGSIA